MWINLVCGLVFFLMVPGILFTVPAKSKYVTAAVHAVLFVIAHHFVNAFLRREFGMEEPRLPPKPVPSPTLATLPSGPAQPRISHPESAQLSQNKVQKLTEIQEAQNMENVPAKF
jgi:hypothetical protein